MPIYAIHTRRAGKSIPLLWDLDPETKARVDGANLAVMFCYPERKDAERIMGECAALFDMDDDKANTLHIVEYKPS